MKLTVKNNAKHNGVTLEFAEQTEREKLLEEQIRALIDKYNRTTDAKSSLPLEKKAEKDLQFVGYKSGEIRPLQLKEITCFNIEEQKLFAHTQNGKYKLKERLCDVEAMMGDSFLKINQSCIVRIENVLKFDTSISGSLKVVLDTGYEDYVSRRQLKAVKERILGIKK